MATEQEDLQWYGQVEGLLSRLVQIQPSLYSHISDDGMATLSKGAGRYLSVLFRHLMERDKRVQEVCARKSEFALSEFVSLVIDAERSVFERQLQWYRKVMAQLSDSDREYLENNVLPTAGLGFGLIGQVPTQERMQRLVEANPDKIEAKMDGLCVKRRGQYEFVQRFADSAGGILETRFIRSMEDEELE